MLGNAATNNIVFDTCLISVEINQFSDLLFHTELDNVLYHDQEQRHTGVETAKATFLGVTYKLIYRISKQIICKGFVNQSASSVVRNSYS